MFKPFFTSVPASHQSFGNTPGPAPDNSNWWRWEQWHRAALCNYRYAKQTWIEKALPVEKAWLSAGDGNNIRHQSPETLQQITATAIQTSLDTLTDMLETLHRQPGKPPGLLYRYAWQRWNRQAGFGTVCG
jgi:hypothetical protein